MISIWHFIFCKVSFNQMQNWLSDAKADAAICCIMMFVGGFVSKAATCSKCPKKMKFNVDTLGWICYQNATHYNVKCALKKKSFFDVNGLSARGLSKFFAFSFQHFDRYVAHTHILIHPVLSFKLILC